MIRKLSIDKENESLDGPRYTVGKLSEESCKNKFYAMVGKSPVMHGMQNLLHTCSSQQFILKKKCSYGSEHRVWVMGIRLKPKKKKKSGTCSK